MAPITRSSVHGRRTEPPQVEVEDQRPLDLESDDGEMSVTGDLISSDIDPEGDVDMNNVNHTSLDDYSAQELLRPVQEAYDRVGKQLEEYGRVLDKFRAERGSSKPQQERCVEAAQALDKYAAISRTHADKLRRSSRLTRDLANEQQADRLAYEADLLTLASRLITIYSPDEVDQVRFRRNAGLVELHQYSTSSEVWNVFLECDLTAQHYEYLLEWLANIAQRTSPQIEDLIAESYTKAQRGQGTWSSGHIFTKDFIKRIKRTTNSPDPLKAQNSGLEDVHVRDSDDSPLVTQLDPDVQYRQAASLALEDEYHEESMWQMCWLQMRQGLSFEDIRTVWLDRSELWRLHGTGACTLGSDANSENLCARIATLASNRELAARMLELTETDSRIGKYQRAVYGLVAGSASACKPVCETVDDNLYCLVNELLIRRFEQFLACYHHKLKDSTAIRYQNAQANFQEIEQCMRMAQALETTKAVATLPERCLEVAIMAKDWTRFFIEVGHAAAQVASISSDAGDFFEHDEVKVSDSARLTAQQEDMIRVVAHLQICLDAAGLLQNTTDEDQRALDNNVVNQIVLLEKHGRWDVLPCYANRLSTRRGQQVLGRLLITVRDPKERALQIRLMKSYNMDISKIVLEICSYARAEWIRFQDQQNGNQAPLKLIEYKVKDGEQRTKIASMREKFMDDDKAEETEAVIAAHQWLQHVNAEHWPEAVDAIVGLYKSCLLRGKLSAAALLAANVTLTETSLKATGMNLGLLVRDPVTPDGVERDYNDSAEEAAGPLSPSKNRHRRSNSDAGTLLHKNATDRQTLAIQSQTCLEMEQLMQVIDAFDIWTLYVSQVETSLAEMQKSTSDTAKAHTTEAMKLAKKSLRKALQTIVDNIQSLFEPGFLCSDDNDKVLDQIRNHYVPECILAYNSVMYFAGFFLTRQHLVECMNLAQMVATNETLTKAFVESKRMKELVTAFAADSQALLRANEGGESRSKAKRVSIGTSGRGRSDIWQVQWRENVAAQ